MKAYKNLTKFHLIFDNDYMVLSLSSRLVNSKAVFNKENTAKLNGYVSIFEL